MFRRSLPRGWMLIGHIIVPSINTFNWLLISYLIERIHFDIWNAITIFFVIYLMNLLACVPLTLCSHAASKQWKRGFYLRSRMTCCISGIILLLTFNHLLSVASAATTALNPSVFTLISPLPLLMIWSLGLILVSFLLREPRCR